MHLFGLTGGVASGKSTVAARFRERGVPVIDADAIARELVAPGTEGLRAVVEAFGAAVLRQGGALDRARLGRLVFADEGERARLEAILHPRIRVEARRRAAALGARGSRLGCYEAALLVEKGLADDYRPLVVVAAPEPAQIERLMARDGLARNEAVRRVRAQLPLPDKAAVADYAIDNSGTCEELLRRADEVLGRILRLVGATDPGG
ncbi:MAG: dephospho-CoA kinase [Deltaproteobacteria bacterium]|nr:dephospho-CoA kinase [Deltaproteobacteria bacterium]